MTNPIKELSNALAALVSAAASQVIAIRHSEFRHLTGLIWQPDLIVTSEQSLRKRDRYDVVLNGGGTASASLIGRDAGTNIALLKLAQTASMQQVTAGEAVLGSLAVALGADGTGAATARLGVVSRNGPTWFSRRGGRIDRRIAIDTQLSPAEEGGPVLDAEGKLIGMSSFGPRRRLIVIPAATLERIVPVLLKDGRVAQGWLGAALHPVAVPDALQQAAGQTAGMMVMSVADNGPCAVAGALAGDILVTVGGEPARHFRRVASLLGHDSIGKQLDLRLIRGGGIISLTATITPRPEK